MDLFGLDLDELDGAMTTRGVDGISDGALTVLVSDVLAQPRTADTSFTLHATLELLARVRLLERVSPSARGPARRRLVALAAGYDRAGEPIDTPEDAPPSSGARARQLLRTALTRADADEADRAAIGLGRHADPAECRELLTTDVVPLLGAAGHAPILLANWPRVTPPHRLNGSIIRHLFRDLAHEGHLRFRFEHPNAGRPTGSLIDLDRVLAAVQPVGDPGFGVYRLMHQAEQHRALAGFPSVERQAAPDAFRLVLRRAANAMLTDDPAHAPYGWSHALTMPLALAQVAPYAADPTVALDAALTQWCGFRMGHGRGDVEAYQPHPGDTPLAELGTDEPHRAAAVAWHHAPDAAVVQALVDNAATSHDAHLVKYTVACLDAATMDPRHHRLYLAAAAYLAAWWRAAGPGDDPLAGAAS